jgi:hypothetical protein
MMWNNSWGVGGWILMTLMMISFWALVVGVVIWLLRHSARQQPPAPGRTGRPADPRPTLRPR